MHNIYTSYVYLVDRIGRDRCAGSGEGSNEEVSSMIQFAKQLTQEQIQARPKQKQSSGPRIGKRLPN